MNGALELEMKNISKSFAGVSALEGVDFAVRPGEVHALLGANGAGKSTLMKILSGAYGSDAGTISIGDRRLSIASPADAKAEGIHCVYQEVDTSLVPHLTVAENMMLDRIAAGKGPMWMNWAAIGREAEAVLARIGSRIPVRRRADELTLAEKQIVLIARVLVQEAKYVILDEPTAPLSLEEADRLFGIMDELKRQGIGIVFISHRLPEVKQVSDRITVMRDGKVVLSEPAADVATGDIVRAMLGRSFEEEYPKTTVPIGETLFEVEDIAAGHRVRGVNLTVRRGEIVAVVGLVGAGKTELSRLLFGADPAERGTVRIAGRTANAASPADAVRAGIALVPEERRKEGILVGSSVLHNLSLPILRQLSRIGFISKPAERGHAEDMIGRLGIRTASSGQPTGFLSGGNQQKVAIGKWMATDAEVFLFDEPTKGVDVGAKRDIFRIIGELAGAGKGVLYLTCEFAEALGLADRILVMCDGAIVKSFDRGDVTMEELLYYASAGKEDLA
ncbi:sugar ABC transporter ATP-binding protein [Cohnella sp. JJ-181]|uniref:sugar ABC transporter ATP-binding protein n=1 Tax=Cohnella rhizoplanae TaxID=2974897 RepID=UPI0022FF74C8|nr:sugar ABC transporter ATP-binding protein [Cohnella sp. JJ-181]CAI6080871.1 Ribose import ATP-binding protein RbsA [Cohnella sp. JJ-181]